MLRGLLFSIYDKIDLQNFHSVYSMLEDIENIIDQESQGNIERLELQHICSIAMYLKWINATLQGNENYGSWLDS